MCAFLVRVHERESGGFIDSSRSPLLLGALIEYMALRTIARRRKVEILPAKWSMVCGALGLRENGMDRWMGEWVGDGAGWVAALTG